MFLQSFLKESVHTKQIITNNLTSSNKLIVLRKGISRFLIKALQVAEKKEADFRGL